MYPSIGQAIAQQNDYAAPMQSPAPSGVASRVAELQKAIAELQEMSYHVKTSLGISVPAETKTPVQPSTLAEVLTDLRVRITRSVADLQDVLQHLNS